MRQDILWIAENQTGQDKIIGDLHGNVDVLKEALQQLGPHDRLFLVGDLFDKGKNSKEVLEILSGEDKSKKYQAYKNRIYIIRGNHENLFLEYASYKLNKNKTKKDLEQLADFEKYYFDKQIGAGWVQNLSDQELEKYADWIMKFPYIIYVQDRQPFVVVHAEMPISDADIIKRMEEKNYSLSPQERYHAVWARHGDRDTPFKNFKDSTLVKYCGHTALGGIRAATHHCNLDVGSYLTGTGLLVSHQSFEISWIVTNQFRNFNMNSMIKFQKQIEVIINGLYQYFLSLKVDDYRHWVDQRLIDMLEACKSMPGMEKAHEHVKELMDKIADNKYQELSCLEAAFIEEKEAWCKGARGIFKKTAKDFVQELNKVENHSSYARMVGYLIREIYELNPRYSRKVLVIGIEPGYDRQFKKKDEEKILLPTG